MIWQSRLWCGETQLGNLISAVYFRIRSTIFSGQFTIGDTVIIVCNRVYVSDSNWDSEDVRDNTYL